MYAKVLLDVLPGSTKFMQRLGHRISAGDWIEKRGGFYATCHVADCKRSFILYKELINPKNKSSDPYFTIIECSKSYNITAQNTIVGFNRNTGMASDFAIRSHQNLKDVKKFLCTRFAAML